MYRIYSTEGLVLQSFNVGEASKILALFTKDFGLLHARAQGVRAERSKLRYHVQDFSFGRFELVRGKNGWRMTNANDVINLVRTGADYEERRAAAQSVIVHVGALLTRLLNGEEKDEKFYSDVITSFHALQSVVCGSEFLKDFEALFVMRILHRLGYWGDDAILSPFLNPFEIEKTEMLASFAPVRARAIRRINEALRETQL